MKYDHKAIIQDYIKGLSIPDLNRKYGISWAYAYFILKRAGVIRSISESKLRSSKGWRKLSKVGKKRTRIVSIPIRLITQVGFSPNDELEGKWKPVRKGVLLLMMRRRRTFWRKFF